MNYREEKLQSGIYLVGVPIGNARDITLRALDVLAGAEVLAAEDTRSLRRLMDIHGVALKGRRIVALHEHSGQARVEKLVAAAQTGQSVGYASEAGMPLIADPGFELVRAARQAGVAVTAVPGASAVLTGLCLSGLATDAFYFAGFLPAAKGARRKALEKLAEIEATLVLFEAPKRVARTLRDAAEILGGERQAVLARELTKRFEEVRGERLTELAEDMATREVKGEVVLLIDRQRGPASINDSLCDDMLSNAMIDLSLKDAVAIVARQTGLRRRDVYQRALALSTGKAERTS